LRVLATITADAHLELLSFLTYSNWIFTFVPYPLLLKIELLLFYTLYPPTWYNNSIIRIIGTHKYPLAEAISLYPADYSSDISISLYDIFNIIDNPPGAVPD